MYNRLFTKILDSSIWLEPLGTRVVWITLLAAMDEDGFAAFACPENLARRAGVTAEECELALTCLLGPDANSSDPDNEGRRVERIGGGYLILNATKYRALFSREIQREQVRHRVAKHRAKQRDVTQCNASVTVGNDHVTQSEAEAEAEAEEKTLKGRFHKDARTVLWLLNEATGRKFRETSSNLEFISARLSEPEVSLDGVKLMIARQVKRWKGTPQAEYLRPATLFNQEKFDGYYAAKDLPLDTNGKTPETTQLTERISVPSL